MPIENEPRENIPATKLPKIKLSYIEKAWYTVAIFALFVIVILIVRNAFGVLLMALAGLAYCGIFSWAWGPDTTKNKT